MNQKKKRVALGLSGGVDSAVTAHLLQQQGYDVTAVFIECFRAPGCRTDDDRRDALLIAQHLGLPFISLDFRDAYNQQVWQYFYDEYRSGRTPNPDVFCNRDIKFGLFLQWALTHNFDFIATGHYARLSSLVSLLTSFFPQKNIDKIFINLDKETANKCFLSIPIDFKKDQTYFLNQINGQDFSHLLFPLSELTKPQVRQLAQNLQLPVADKKDSTGVCFVGENFSVADFLRQHFGEKKGNILDLTGRQIGQHHGAWFYTIGQRHGFDIDQKSPDTPPLFVVNKNINSNTITVGPESALNYFTITVTNINWLIPNSNLFSQLLASFPLSQILVRIRHQGKLHPCNHSLFNSLSSSSLPFQLHLQVESPLRAPAPGQFAVLYLQLDPNQSAVICLGGGIII